MNKNWSDLDLPLTVINEFNWSDLDGKTLDIHVKKEEDVTLTFGLCKSDGKVYCLSETLTR
jgi:hypothetical protein